MPKRVKFGHGYYYIVTPQELQENHMKGKKVVIEGTIEDKPIIEFLPMELPSYRTTFHIEGLKIEFSGTPVVKKGDQVKIYGRFIGHSIVARAIETEYALFITEE
ncbi:GTP-binding protein [Palaeococcus pacificus DY20341]|uniref:GTP-binding protein n=1 Tax=Palaeococcus pacificus DY20341 TaxID=1343739 RepID=A0A075LUV9_9EURY|nr:hypothetical protein [Palaeococcus pacificus]AIF69777.1 GTP-binding protein [Palaeococcus pacificus DY20341]